MMNKLEHSFSEGGSQVLERNITALFPEVGTASILSKGVKEESISSSYERMGEESQFLNDVKDNIKYLPVFSFPCMDSKVGEVIFRRDSAKNPGPVSIVSSPHWVSKLLTELGNGGMFIKNKTDLQAEHTGRVIGRPAYFFISISEDTSDKDKIDIGNNKISQSSLDFAIRTYPYISRLKPVEGKKGRESLRERVGILSRNFPVNDS